MRYHKRWWLDYSYGMRQSCTKAYRITAEHMCSYDSACHILEAEFALHRHHHHNYWCDGFIASTYRVARAAAAYWLHAYLAHQGPVFDIPLNLVISCVSVFLLCLHFHRKQGQMVFLPCLNSGVLSAGRMVFPPILEAVYCMPCRKRHVIQVSLVMTCMTSTLC